MLVAMKGHMGGKPGGKMGGKKMGGGPGHDGDDYPRAQGRLSRRGKGALTPGDDIIVSMDLRVVLVEPENPLNVGLSCARCARSGRRTPWWRRRSGRA